MELFYHYLPDIWFVIIGFLLLYYAATDGFDLGVGIISIFCRNEEERGLMMGSIVGVWHDNQTWLVLLGGMMFGAFPVFYGILLSSLYIPITVMLIALIFRGVSFEFRNNSAHKRAWGLSFSYGSLVAAGAQGIALGGLFSGLEATDTTHVANIWTWVNPYSILATAGVIAGYVMLGANYLILKAEGELQNRAFLQARRASYFTIAISFGIYIWTALRYPFFTAKLASVQGIAIMAVFPLLALISLATFYYGLSRRREFMPLLANISMVICGFAGLSVGLYPYIIPNVIANPVTIEKTAASTPTLFFMFVVAMIIIPLIITYTIYKYHVFRGKASLYENE